MRVLSSPAAIIPSIIQSVARRGVEIPSHHGRIRFGTERSWGTLVVKARRGLARWGAGTGCCGFLCACTVGPDFVRPPAPAVTQYTSERGVQLSPSDARQVEQTVTLGQQPPPEWWRQFQSSTLDQVVEEAIGHNRSLAATAATLAQAQQQVLAASGALFPQIDFAASVGEQKYGAAFVGTAKIPPAFSAFSLGPSVSYALDIFGGIKRQIENQEALAEFQRYQLDGAY